MDREEKRENLDSAAAQRRIFSKYRVGQGTIQGIENSIKARTLRKEGSQTEKKRHSIQKIYNFCFCKKKNHLDTILFTATSVQIKSLSTTVSLQGSQLLKLPPGAPFNASHQSHDLVPADSPFSVKGCKIVVHDCHSS